MILYRNVSHSFFIHLQFEFISEMPVFRHWVLVRKIRNLQTLKLRKIELQRFVVKDIIHTFIACQGLGAYCIRERWKIGAARFCLSNDRPLWYERIYRNLFREGVYPGCLSGGSDTLLCCSCSSFRRFLLVGLFDW